MRERPEIGTEPVKRGTSASFGMLLLAALGLVMLLVFTALTLLRLFA